MATPASARDVNLIRRSMSKLAISDLPDVDITRERVSLDHVVALECPDAHYDRHGPSVLGVVLTMGFDGPDPPAAKDEYRIQVQQVLSLIHISEPTRLGMISYAVF